MIKKLFKKQIWQERARSTREYHIGMLTANPQWRMTDTAEALGRSLGAISEDLMLASYLRTYPKLEKIKTVYTALEFVRTKKKELGMQL